MKTIEDALNDGMQELIENNNFEVDAQSILVNVLKKHITPFLAQTVDAAAMRKAEVARIAEALFIAVIVESGNSADSHRLSAWSFKSAEPFVAYKESLKWYIHRELDGGPQWEDTDNALYMASGYHKLRLKPRTMNINGHDVPWPITEAPAVGTRVYAASLLDGGKTSIGYEWDGSDLDKRWLEARILHLTEANARLHIKALRSFFEVKE
jgi:hypothetical protein